MIPKFPQFKKLELNDRDEVTRITSKYPPYSDFNFVSMYSWDTKGEMELSILNNNLVVKFTDYINGQPFFSFLGDNMVNETVGELLSFSKKTHGNSEIRLIPEHVAQNINDPSIDLNPEKDAYDYIYEVAHLADMHNWSKHTSGKNVRSFSKKYPNYEVRHEGIENVDESAYLDMFARWAKNKEIDDYIGLNEYKALDRIFETNHYRLNAVSIYVDGVMVGFTIYEVISPEYAVSHFAKADLKHHHAVSDILNWEEAKILNSLGIKYFNWEQDLGIPGLRKSKEKYKPSHHLKKHIVCHKK